jgi:shikimate dehydrogenase
MTRAYAEVIGDPIAHSKSPLIHNFWLAKLGIDAEYRACHVRANELADYFARRRHDAAWRGCNVTIPHKVAAWEFAETVSDEVLMIGATNCVVSENTGLRAYNTDAQGFAEPLSSLHSSGDKDAYIVGAGGAARAAAFILYLNGWRVTFVARNRDAARHLADDIAGDRSCDIETMSFEQFQPLVLDLWTRRPDPDHQLLVNATSLGMVGMDELPFDIKDINRNTTIYDMVYAPLETTLLKQARHLGLGTIDGLQMLVGQAAAAFELFFGQPAPREHDAELRALLTS